MHMTFGRLGAVDAAAKMSGMEGALPATTWRFAGVRRDLWLLTLYALASLALVVLTSAGTGPGGDWYRVWEPLPARLADGSLYAADSLWRYSPVAAWIIAYGILPLGLAAFALVHVLAVAPIARFDRRLAALTLFGWPFLTDVIVGNVFTFVFVAAVLALRDSRWAVYATFAMFLLMPRPVVLPLVLWLLWKHRDLWIGFALLFLAHAALVLASGYAGAWLGVLVASSSEEVQAAYNIGPSRLLGHAWLLAGVPLAAWLLARGRVGLSGLALSPYLLPQYLLMGLLELRQSRRPDLDVADAGRERPFLALKKRTRSPQAMNQTIGRKAVSSQPTIVSVAGSGNADS
jgi:hypothetical protein